MRRRPGTAATAAKQPNPKPLHAEELVTLTRCKPGQHLPLLGANGGWRCRACGVALGGRDGLPGGERRAERSASGASRGAASVRSLAAKGPRQRGKRKPATYEAHAPD